MTHSVKHYVVALILAAAIVGAFAAGIGTHHATVVDHTTGGDSSTTQTFNDGFTDGMRNAAVMTPAEIHAWLNQ